MNYLYICGKYESLVANNPDVDFILAHGRPLTQIVPLLHNYSNAYADSAFMPTTDMFQLIREGLSHKLLWGTDMCIPKYYRPDEDMQAYYQRKLKTFKDVCINGQYEQVTFKNAVKLWHLR